MISTTMEGSQKTVQSAIQQFNREEEEQRAAQRAVQMGVSYFDVRNVQISPDVLSLLSVDDARRGVVAIIKKDKNVFLGATDPKGEVAQHAAAYLSKVFQVQVGLVTWDAIKDLLPKFDGVVQQNLEKKTDYEVRAADAPLTFEELITDLNEAPLQDILSYLVRIAIDSNSSDIHIEPSKSGARIRFRIDGVLHIVGNLSEERFKYVLSQIELTSGMKLNSNQSQEGRFEVSVKEKMVSVRVETMPTLYGDDISLRIFNTEAMMLSLENVGFNDYHWEIIKKAIERPQGIFLVVGPTGSGKTSTIYAVLNTINKPEIKIITLEDPIEYALDGITQSQIHEDESFYERLKAVLREDPDVVMVGEIREKETAEVAIHGALTGHVMISTFHANDTATAVTMLREITGNSTLLASAINMILAQRLVRRLCPHCKKDHILTGAEKEYVESRLKGIPPEVLKERPIKVFESTGCEKCAHIGYQGRVGIFEMLSPTIEFQKVIGREEATVAEIKQVAKTEGMITMEEDGIIKALDGITSIAEVMRAVRE